MSIPQPQPPVDADQRTMTPLGAILGRPRRRGTMSQEDRQSVIDELFFEGREFTPFLWRFSVLILLSTLIATLGLVANSVAVIIGAMLVAPLMTPILATAAAIVQSHPFRLMVSVGVLLWGMAIAIVTAIAVTGAGLENLTTASALPSEIIGRTQPSLVDLGVAVAAGLAAGYVLTHPRASSSFAGVAVAVALVPPLATVGITFQIGAREESRGALLLFTTNLVAIVLSAIIVMLVSGLAPTDGWLGVSRSARIGLSVSLAALIVIAVPLTLHTLDVLRDREFGADVARAVAAWDPNAEIGRMRADVADSGTATVDLVVATTSSQIPPVWRLVESVASDTGYVVDLQIRVDQEVRRAATSG
jgi:uncharacterized hydrophobic protein (TIGR00271 family)